MLGISVDCIMKSGWTGLMHAASCGLPEVVIILTERGANVNFQKGMYVIDTVNSIMVKVVLSKSKPKTARP
jgi:ankyrin repeat protein